MAVVIAGPHDSAGPTGAPPRLSEGRAEPPSYELEAVARLHFAQEEEIYLLLQGDAV